MLAVNDSIFARNSFDGDGGGQVKPRSREPEPISQIFCRRRRTLESAAAAADEAAATDSDDDVDAECL